MIKKTQKGFTLIEVMIAVVILSILAAIAIPSYSKFITKTRRTDATNMLIKVAAEQQRFKSDHNKFADTMAELGYDNDPMPSEEGWYQITVAKPTPSTYVLTATPVAGQPQATDAECGAFTLRSNGVQNSDGGPDCW